ncbi:MAG: diphthine synthase [Candidatus Diapherotrites archaeon]|nr:diphthine synthase [Candidatus Diapherotrites archaeon]
MFYIIGLGLKPSHLSLEAKEAIGKSDRVFLETYTSTYSEGSFGEIENQFGKPLVKLDRKGVEEGFLMILKDAKRSGESIALLVFGNPLSATTHVQLLIDAKHIGIPTEVVPGISIYDFLGVTGLDQYRFGRACTIVVPKENYVPESFYDIVEKNFAAGLHTLCLLDLDMERNCMLSVSDALSILVKIEKKRGKQLLQKATLVGLYAMGSGRQMIKVGTLQELQRSSYSLFPQSLVVAAPLTEKEKEAIRELHG